MKKLLFIIALSIPVVAFSQLRQNRAIELLGGVAINDGSGGYHLSVAAGPQWQHFGAGVYTSFVNTPSNKFSNWTILGLQMKVLAGDSGIRPYGVFDFGLFNLQSINEKVNLRTASLDLGAGIDKSLRNNNGLLFDARYKWLVDYAGKRDAIGIFTLSIGLRF